MCLRALLNLVTTQACWNRLVLHGLAHDFVCCVCKGCLADMGAYLVPKLYVDYPRARDSPLCCLCEFMMLKNRPFIEFPGGC